MIKNQIKNLFLIACFSFLILSCKNNKKPSYPEFNKAYSEFIDIAVNELGTKHGLALAVIKDDAIIFEKYSGIANVLTGEKVDESTLFYIASITKSFTALAALSLEEKGKLSLDTSLAVYFPEINFDPALKADKITIHELIIHTSGIEIPGMINSTAYTGIHDEELLFNQLKSLSKVNENAPFGKFEYTNLGYNILGMILKREFGKDWKSIVEEEVFTTLQMKHSSTNMSTAKNNGWKVAKPHTQLNPARELKRLYLEKKDNIMHAAGGIISTPRDMSKYIIMHLNKGKLNGKQVFQADLITKSQLKFTEQTGTFLGVKDFGYGYGWNQSTTSLGDTIIQHSGGFTGAVANVTFNPSNKTGIVVMANEKSRMGIFLTTQLTSYVFDYFSGRKNIKEYYTKKIKDFNTQIKDRIIAVHAKNKRRKTVKWNLELPLSNYVGVYKSELFGDLIIKQTSNGLIAKLGNLKSTTAQAGKIKNSLNVEMVPGRWKYIIFKLKNGKVNEAIWDGQKYFAISK